MSIEADRRTEVTKALAKSEELRQEKNHQEAISLLTEVLQHGIETAQVYYRLGNVYYDAKKFEHAEYSYRRAIDNDPNHVNAHYNLGVVYKRMGRIDESMKMRKKANKIVRQHPEKLKVSQEQIKQVRSMAKGMLIVGLVVVLLFIGVMFLLFT